MWTEKNTKAIMGVKSTGAEEFVEFTVCPAYEHAYSSSGLAVLQWNRITLGRFIGVRDNFHLNFICRWLYVFTRIETAGTKIMYHDHNKNINDLAKKIFRGRHFILYYP